MRRYMLGFSDDYQEKCLYLWDMRDMTLVAQLHTDVGVRIPCALSQSQERDRDRDRENKENDNPNISL